MTLSAFSRIRCPASELVDFGYRFPKSHVKFCVYFQTGK